MRIQTSPEAMEYLKRKDGRLGAVIDRLGPIERQGNADLFSAVVRHIVGQQISTKAQQTVWTRLTEVTGGVEPDRLAELPAAVLQSAGLSFRKADYIRGFAQAVHTGELDLEVLRQMEDEAVIRTLCKLPGIGDWTAQMLLIFSLGRPDVLSYGDFGILKGLRMVYRHRRIDPDRFRRFQRRYSPHGTAAGLYLWAVAGGAIPGLNDPGKRK
jgi:DNA-3-methyladenine glycosylase II